MFPLASFVTVVITTPSLSLSTKLNSLALSTRPSKRFVKLNSTETGMFTTRFSVGLFGFFTVLLVGSY